MAFDSSKVKAENDSYMRRNSLHCKSLVLGYYPILPEMFWSSGFLIFRRKNRWKMIFDGSYGKLFSRSFSFYFSTDFSIHSFLNNSWGNLVYKRNQGVECHGNHRTQLYQMSHYNHEVLQSSKQVTWDHITVTDRWAGAPNPNQHPAPTPFNLGTPLKKPMKH